MSNKTLKLNRSLSRQIQDIGSLLTYAKVADQNAQKQPIKKPEYNGKYKPRHNRNDKKESRPIQKERKEDATIQPARKKWNRIPSELLDNTPPKGASLDSARIFCIQSYKEDKHLNFYIHFYNNPYRHFVGMLSQRAGHAQFYIVSHISDEPNNEGRLFGSCDSLPEAIEIMLDTCARRFNLTIDKSQAPEYRNLCPFVFCYLAEAIIPF